MRNASSMAVRVRKMIMALGIGASLYGSGPSARAEDAGVGVVGGYGQAVVSMTIYRGAIARVTLVGQAGVDVDLTIYDGCGRRVGRSAGSGSCEFVVWYPQYTGTFYAVVSNADSCPSRYVLTVE